MASAFHFCWCNKYFIYKSSDSHPECSNGGCERYHSFLLLLLHLDVITLYNFSNNIQFSPGSSTEPYKTSHVENLFVIARTDFINIFWQQITHFKQKNPFLFHYLASVLSMTGTMQAVRSVSRKQIIILLPAQGQEPVRFASPETLLYFTAASLTPLV